MAILRGHFAMTLSSRGPSGRRSTPTWRLGLEAYSVTEVAEAAASPRRSRTPSCPCTAPTTPGSSPPSRACSRTRAANVCDLQTWLARDLYVMIIDVAVPPELGLHALDASLQAVAAEQGVALTLRPADADVL